jgi:hypothetical protein
VKKDLSCFPQGHPPSNFVYPAILPIVAVDIAVGAAMETITLPYDIVVEPRQPDRSEIAGKKSSEELYPSQQAPTRAEPVPSPTPSA